MSNTQILAHLLEEKYGIKALEKIQKKGDMIIYPSEYFTAHKGVTSNTRCIHHFGASWLPLDRRVKDKIIKYKNRIIRRDVYKRQKHRCSLQVELMLQVHWLKQLI